MRPCYLDGRGGLRVMLDGPALIARRPGRATTLVPLRHISRIIASGPVELTTATLLACAARGITVTFLDEAGALRAYLFGETTRREGLLQRLVDFLDRPDWQDCYDNWRRSIDSHARRRLCWRLGLTADSYSLSYLLFELQAKQRGVVSDRQRGLVAGRLQGMARALAAELLADTGLDAARARSLVERLDLLEDLARWLAVDLQWPLLQWLERRPPGQPLTGRALTELFEGRARRLRTIGRVILNRLYRFVLEGNE